MLKHILNFPKYVAQGYSLGKDRKFRIKKINKIIVCGMGGSGISGHILQDYVTSIPVFVNKNYDIPSFIDKNTLAIIISYSGNTEETIAAYEKISERTKKKFIITSGGTLGWKKKVIKVFSGLPPRYSLPFLFFSMLAVLNDSNIIRKDFDLDEIVENLSSIRYQETQEFANKLIGYIPLIYASEGYGSVAYRWQTQFNENSKILAHSQVFPEHNHNEIEAKLEEKFKPIMLKDPEADIRIRKSMNIIQEMTEAEEVILEGDSKLSRMFYGIMFGDLLTYYLAVKQGVNPSKQDNIDALKEKLKQ